MRNAEIGAAIDELGDDVKRRAVALVGQYRRRGSVATLKQAVDTPHRARAQLTAWIADYNSRNGAGSAQTFLAQCLTAAGSTKTLGQVNAELAALEAQAQNVVDRVATDGWTWEQVASAIEAQIAPDPAEAFDYTRLPIPAGYVTVWNEPW
jgi:hypothetical protein